MGFEWLLEKNVWDNLDEHIVFNNRHIIPGYKYNYCFCSFPGYIEFYRCELLDGTLLKTDIHAASDYIWKLKVQDLITEDISAPIFSFKNNSGKNIPVRVICSDILPSINCGDMIEGQVIAFADSITKQTDISGENNVEDAGENCVFINGTITDAIDNSFEFDDIESFFWEIDMETENGAITVLIAKDSIDFTPECGDVVCAHAMIQMDVAITHSIHKIPDYYEDYQCLLEDSDDVYRNGFVPGFHTTQKVFVNSIENGELCRLLRCCDSSISFASNNDNEYWVRIINKEQLIEALKISLPQNIEKVEIKHFLSCKVKSCVGQDAIVIYSNGQIKLAIWFDICEKGVIDEIRLFTPEDCTLGIDYELHLHTMFAHAICDSKWYILHEYITHGCMYRSEYADICLVGAKNIIDRFADINGRLDETTRYTYELAYTKDELSEFDDLPIIYQGNRCTINYQGGNLAYVVFLIINDEHKICNILLSKNSNYLKCFESKKTIEDEKNAEIKTVVEILSSVYGTDNTIETMRNNEIPDIDTYGVYIWKKTDEFATSWLGDNGYKVSDSVLVDDCIGYACKRKGTEYAVFFYAYGERKTTLLDGDYCSKLRNESISQGRGIVIIYLHVAKKTNDDGAIEYTVGSYGSEENKIEPWLLTTVMGKRVLRFYPRKEMMDLIPRLIAAFNSKNLDALKALCSSDAFLETFEHSGQSVNDGFYSHLSSIREEHGKMKLAYIRFQDVVFSAVPYIDNYAYISFTANNEDKIDSIKMNPLSNEYRELIITDENVDYCLANDVPNLSSVDVIKPSKISRFSLRLNFENGEIKRYNLSGEFNDNEVVTYQRKVMTDKIFANARIVGKLPMPDWMGYRNYAERGQGIEFISGITISTIELYRNSYPIEKFSYAGMENVHVRQMDYDEDGFGVGYISDMDPMNPHYLLDRNTMTATVLPDEYQATPIGIYPFYGGYSEGLVMVSKFGEMDLQYHHNRGSCAGLWGWLDRELNVVIEPKYVYAMNFVNGKAIVCKGNWNIITSEDGEDQYWCDNERWGIIDKNEMEIVPCRFDEIYEIDNTDKLYFVHEGGWDNGHYAIFDTEDRDIILVLDFDFDFGYMFNECFVTDENVLVFDEHLPGEEKDLIYAYDLINKQYIAHGEPLEGRTFNGETKSVVNKDGKDIIIF